MTMRNKIMLGLMLFFLYSCDNKCEIEIAPSLVQAGKNNNIDYCSLISKSLEPDFTALKKITFSECGGASGCYELGNVLIKLIAHVGDEYYLKSVKDISYEEKRTIFSLLKAGLEYGDNKDQGKTLYEFSPRLYDFLNQK